MSVSWKSAMENFSVYFNDFFLAYKNDFEKKTDYTIISTVL